MSDEHPTEAGESSRFGRRPGQPPAAAPGQTPPTTPAAGSAPPSRPLQPGGPRPAAAAPSAAPPTHQTPAHARAKDSSRPLEYDAMLTDMVGNGASDLHISVGLPPMQRVHGDLEPLPGYPVLTAEMTQRLVGSIMNKENQAQLQKNKEADFAYAIQGLARFRVNIFFQMGYYGSVMRQIPEKIPTFEEIGLPKSLARLTTLSRGLVLVTGPTGSGKSTSLAAIINQINMTRHDHILTIEDPVEFVHQHKKCVVNQREVHKDTLSFSNALRAALREDPDVILVGEMRDLETIETAITAAETGHLVFGTLHTQNAPSTIDRVIDVFPAHQQAQIRAQLGATLQAVITQTLLPRKDKPGRVAAHEILHVNEAISNQIREAKIHQIRSTMQTSAQLGMQTMDKALADLVKLGVIDLKLARERAQNVNDFSRLLSGDGAPASGPAKPGGQPGQPRPGLKPMEMKKK